MIYTVTLNPSVDYVLYMNELKTGVTNRSTHEAQYFGGKGINVSAVLNELGASNKALGFVAGYTGHAIEEGLKAKGLNTNFIHLKDGQSRINVKIKHGVETEINAAGPKVSDEEANALFVLLDEVQDGDVLVLSGSIPSSLPEDLYERILARLQTRELIVAVDACGELLMRTLKYRPFLIKPNLEELSDLFDKVITSDEEIIEHARKLQGLGAKNVLVSLGEKGAILLTENGETEKAKAKEVDAINSVGAGDSMVAGFLFGYLRTKDYREALKLAIAAAGATVSKEGLAKKEDILKLFK